jgi:hypothetical protein
MCAAAEEEVDVITVRVLFAEAVPETCTWAGLSEHVGGSVAFPGPANCTLHVRDTMPVNPV